MKKSASNKAPSISTVARPAFTAIPGRGGDAICGLSRSMWLRLERDGLIKLARVRRPASKRHRLLLPVEAAVAAIERLAAMAGPKP
jgi:hypothetical protein